MTKQCTRPPPGWYCTRGPHDDGPCAALPVDAQSTSNWMSIEQHDANTALYRAYRYLDRDDVLRIADCDLPKHYLRLALEELCTLKQAVREYMAAVDAWALNGGRGEDEARLYKAEDTLKKLVK